jgi:hypothetical protein
MKKKPGYQKIQFCGRQAAKDDLKYFWVDTCCIKNIDPALNALQKSGLLPPEIVIMIIAN